MPDDNHAAEDPTPPPTPLRRSRAESLGSRSGTRRATTQVSVRRTIASKEIPAKPASVPPTHPSRWPWVIKALGGAWIQGLTPKHKFFLTLAVILAFVVVVFAMIVGVVLGPVPAGRTIIAALIGGGALTLWRRRR